MFNPNAKPKIRTVTVPVKKPVADNRAPSLPRKASTPEIHGAIGAGHGVRKPAAAPPKNRYQLTPSTKSRTSSTPRIDRKQLSVSHTQRKRKSSPATPQFASSDESSDGDDGGFLGIRKRQKTSSSIEPVAVNRCLEPDYRRRIRRQAPEPALENGASQNGSSKEGEEEEWELQHGLRMTRGEWAKDFKPAFSGLEKNPVVRLQYPSKNRLEKFELVVPYDSSNFNPIDDIYFSIEEIITHYLPPDLSADLSSETDGTVRLLKRAVHKNSPSDFEATLNTFNTLIRSKVHDGTIPKVLDEMHALPLSLTKRILAQVYQRTVSPYAHELRKVSGKETTYGELLPPFIHTIFSQTGLNSSHVFIDLGSGVGNVVLQSALQTGAESWGIEILDTPAKYAAHQARELRARAKLWDISLGSIHLLQGDLRDTTPIDAVLARADVILVNNKVFPPKLNEILLNKFLDLKTGCKVVSLASFGGGGKHGVRSEQSIARLFDEWRGESGTGSVSWAGESVEYYIATKAR
ncbi:DOT1-domain-containing protein [Lojkania enalia]|uniref:Histone-lysine N-methyltransferase, H3 lysine-79 specific n=1 Tax=Lojkania enalia TaxID=147567 RepID=A0A9P4TPX3_9PLEO|nr:DOT1-domain-containing protein [Didymosphaeria enalia]